VEAFLTDFFAFKATMVVPWSGRWFGSPYRIIFKLKLRPNN